MQRINPLRLLNIATLCRSQFLLPVLFLFYQENGLSFGDFFLFNGIYSVVSLLFQTPSGYISDFFSKKTILLLSFFLFLIRCVLWLSFRGYWIILTGEILAVMSKAFFLGVSDSYIYEYLKMNNQSKKMLSKYGRLNFFLSIGTALTSITGAFFYSKTSFNFLLFVDFLLLCFAIFLIMLLPKLKVAHKKTSDLKNIYKKLFVIIRITMRNKEINGYILLSAFLATATFVMAFLFQPLMQASNVPVYLFGLVYFVNYSFRAFSGLSVARIMRAVSLKKLGFTSYFLFCAACVLIISSFYFKNAYFTLFSLFFICVAIYTEFMFSMSSIAFIHTKIYTKSRSAISSVNFMVSKTVSALVLVSFKFLLEKRGIYFPLTLFSVLFLLSFPLLNKKYKL